MRRKEQSIGAMQQDKVLLKNKMSPVLKPHGLKRYVAGGEYLSTVSLGLEKVADYLERKDIEEKDNILKADNLLSNYRTVLSNASNSEEFENIAGAINEDVKNFFVSSESGREFWNKHGDKIIENNNLDVEKIRAKKEYDFGKDALKTLLADNQAMIVGADNVKGRLLLESGVSEIENTKFLTDDEKKQYKDGYLKTGIYNLALADINEAREQVNKYKLNLGDDFIKSIDELEGIKEKERQNEIIKNKRKEFVKNWSGALNLWQQKERGEILESEYFVLSKEYDDVLGDVIDGSFNNRYPMSLAYNLVKKMNKRKQIESDEISDASKALIRAYNDNKLSLDDVSNLQNKLIYSQEDGTGYNDFLDTEIDELVDNVFVKDVFSSSRDARMLMEEKARLGLVLNDVYYDKKMALMTKFIKDGGKVTPKVDRILKKQAIDEIKNEFGYVENLGGAVEFSQLKPLIKLYYNGGLENEIWEQFYKKAPFCDDKKSLLREIAVEQQKKELNYPMFNNWAEVIDANLGEDDKFYFKGRLAKKA